MAFPKILKLMFSIVTSFIAYYIFIYFIDADLLSAEHEPFPAFYIIAFILALIAMNWYIWTKDDVEPDHW